MTIYAYCRVSTLDQDTTIQESAIKAAYPNAIVKGEKKSGPTTNGREVLALLLEMIDKGDKLVVWKLDRLARNLHDLTGIVKQLEAKGASLEILDQRIDTATASGKAFLQMLGVFAEFETNLRRERQAAGIAKAKMEGKYLGRKRINDERITKALTLIEHGMSKQAAADKVGVGVATIYRRLKEESIKL